LIGNLGQALLDFGDAVSAHDTPSGKAGALNGGRLRGRITVFLSKQH
jgi:hypothetical protein